MLALPERAIASVQPEKAKLPAATPRLAAVDVLALLALVPMDAVVLRISREHLADLRNAQIAQETEELLVAG